MEYQEEAEEFELQMGELLLLLELSGGILISFGKSTIIIGIIIDDKVPGI